MPSTTEPRSGTIIRYAIGDDVPLQWELEEADGEALAAGRFAALAQVRRYPGAPVLHEWSTVNGRAKCVSQVDGALTRWFLQLLVDDSRDWLWTRGQFDVFLCDDEGRNERIDAGWWISDAAISDRAVPRGTTP